SLSKIGIERERLTRPSGPFIPRSRSENLLSTDNPADIPSDGRLASSAERRLFLDTSIVFCCASILEIVTFFCDSGGDNDESALIDSEIPQISSSWKEISSSRGSPIRDCSSIRARSKAY